eukprot:scaffold5705_cov132-Skeletonema_menzelii.AAC.2
MPTFSFIGGDITTSASSSQLTMSAQSAFAQRISPQQSLDETLDEKKVVGHAKESVQKDEQSNKENERELLAEVCRTWTAGKSSHQTKQAKDAVKRARQRGLAPSKIAKQVVHDLNQRNEPSAGEEERVKQFTYNINRELKKENNQTASQQIATKTSEEFLSTLDDAPTNITELISVGIPYQRNGRIYFQGNHLDSQSKRKASALDQNSMKESKKHMDVESMKQERHLKKLREELKEETDAEVLAELKSDIECLKRKKEEWAKLLGMKEEVVNPSSQSS